MEMNRRSVLIGFGLMPAIVPIHRLMKLPRAKLILPGQSLVYEITQRYVGTVGETLGGLRVVTVAQRRFVLLDHVKQAKWWVTNGVIIARPNLVL